MTFQSACPACGAPLPAGVRFCVACGAPVTLPPAVEVALPGSRRVRLSADTLSLRELQEVVEAGVAYWRQRLDQTEGVAREQAAAALKDLSRILDSLAAQIAQGRETVRITGRMPDAPRLCRTCGRGNRRTARYCVACGAPLRPDVRPSTQALPARTLIVAARTDRGRIRPLNEDTIYAGEFTTSAERIGTLLIVADGMGGHQAGEVASSLAVQALKQMLTEALNVRLPADDAAWHTLLREAVSEANRRIYALSRADSAKQGMGATLTVAIVTATRAHLAHVGDCRAYLMNPAGVTGNDAVWIQLTTDHTVVARLVDIGQLTLEQARTHPQRHMVYRALGVDPTTEVDTLSLALAPGDVLLLCSDGLVNHVDNDELARTVLEAPSADAACERLITLANQRGGADNISVVIARVQSPAA